MNNRYIVLIAAALTVLLQSYAHARGTFLAGAGAGPVYRLPGKKDFGTTEFPPVETGLLSSDLVFRQHSAGHTPNPNWPYFLDFAQREFRTRAAN